MVDFQKRDTRRGMDDADGADEPADGTEESDPDTDRAEQGSDEHDHETEHDHHHGAAATDLGVAILTVSSTRSLEDDPSGDAISAACKDAGHDVATRELIVDDYDRVQKGVDTLTRRRDVDVVITTGGTGVTPDDVTIEAVEPLCEKALPGFGELFRRYSEDEIGTRVIATRATAGIAEGVPVFCLPGSENAARLGTEEIVLPEAGHLVGLAGREAADEE